MKRMKKRMAERNGKGKKENWEEWGWKGRRMDDDDDGERGWRRKRTITLYYTLHYITLYYILGYVTLLYTLCHVTLCYTLRYVTLRYILP